MEITPVIVDYNAMDENLELELGIGIGNWNWDWYCDH